MRSGCAGRMCRACSPIMERMRIVRRELDDRGEPTGRLKQGWVCGFMCAPDTTGLRYDLPGRTDGEMCRLVIAAGSLSPLEAGDSVISRSGRWSVVGTAADGSVMLQRSC